MKNENEALERTLKTAQDQALVRREMIRAGVIRLAPREHESSDTEEGEPAPVLEQQASR